MKYLLIGLATLSLVLNSETFAQTGLPHKGHTMTTPKKISMPKKSTEKKTKAEKKAEKVKCPVTGTEIDPAKTYSKTNYKGKTYYFCCPGCPEKFKKNPEKYIK